MNADEVEEAIKRIQKSCNRIRKVAHTPGCTYEVMDEAQEIIRHAQPIVDSAKQFLRLYD